MFRILVTSALLFLLLASSTDWLGLGAVVSRSGDKAPPLIPVEEECEAEEELRVLETPAWDLISPICQPAIRLGEWSTEIAASGEMQQLAFASTDAIRGSPAC